MVFRRATKHNETTSVGEQDESPAPSSRLQPLMEIPSQVNTTAGRLKAINKSRASSKASNANNSTRSPSGKKANIKDHTSPLKDIIGSTKQPKRGIQSFFSTATQKQQASQESPRRSSRASTPLELTETIDSDDDSTSILSFSKGSSTALALRKRKAYNTNGSTTLSTDDALPASQKFRRTGEATRTPSMTLSNDDKRPWTVQFAPNSLAELAVHKRKVADVRGWLESAFTARRNKILILKGPAGAGKTTTLRLLAEELGLEVLEWSDPAGRIYNDATQSSSAQFEDFITRSGRSNGLDLVQEEVQQSRRLSAPTQTEPSSNQLLLVEEFPITFSKTSPALQSFRSALAQHLVPRSGQSPIPLIMVISETLLSTNTAAADSFTVHRLLGPELSSHPYINTIEFNAVAPSIIMKALETVVVKEARKSGRRTTPAPAVLKRLTDFGDIRSAISTLEFLCLRGDDDGNWSSRIAFGKTKKKAVDTSLTKVEKEALEWIASRESSIGIFHAVGKVLYNKRVEPSQTDVVAAPPEWLSQYHRPRIPENDVNTLVNDIGTDTSTFIAALHENYLLSCNSSGPEQTLDNIFNSIESLSDSDMLSLDRFSFGNRAFSGSATDTLRQDEMSFQLAVRGLLFNIPVNTKRVAPATEPRIDAHRMYYPASLRLWRRREEIQTSIDSLRFRLRPIFAKKRREEVDTAYSLANTDATPWSRHEDDTKDDAIEHAKESFLTLASQELLIECLPYFMSPLKHMNVDKALLELLRIVVMMNRSTIQLDDNNDDPDIDEPSTPAEQWTTDRPDDATTKTSTAKITRKNDDSVFTSTATHLERPTASLVLEDDDIVDD